MQEMLTTLEFVPVGVPFQFKEPMISVYIKVSDKSKGYKLLNTNTWRLEDGHLGNREVVPVEPLLILLEKKDSDNLDELLEKEGEDETRLSRCTRLLEGEDGAIAKTLGEWT